MIGWLLCGTKDIDVPSIGGTIGHRVLVLVPVPRFVIGMCSVLVCFFVDFDYAIFNESLLKDHAFFLSVCVGLKALHSHVMSRTRMGIVNKHLDKIAFWEGARDSSGKGLSSLQVINKTLSSFFVGVD